jgi:HEAT repeat protein
MTERTIVRADEARRRLRELLNEVGAGGVVEIRRYDTPEAVMVSPDWYERAAAALEKIGDERGREAIKPLLKDADLVVKMRVERILAAWKKRTAHA